MSASSSFKNFKLAACPARFDWRALHECRRLSFASPRLLSTGPVFFLSTKKTTLLKYYYANYSAPACISAVLACDASASGGRCQQKVQLTYCFFFHVFLIFFFDSHATGSWLPALSIIVLYVFKLVKFHFYCAEQNPSSVTRSAPSFLFCFEARVGID